MRLTREAIEWWWKGVKALGRGLGYKVWKSLQKYEVNLNMNRNFSKENLFIWFNSEAKWFHLRDARQFAYVQLVGDSCKLESESWSYFSEVWGQGCEHEVILATEWGSGKQHASVSAASWQQGIAECLGCVQVVVEKGERSRSVNSRADSADRRAVWDVTTVANEKGAMSKRASAASMVNAEPLEMWSKKRWKRGQKWGEDQSMSD